MAEKTLSFKFIQPAYTDSKGISHPESDVATFLSKVNTFYYVKVYNVDTDGKETLIQSNSDLTNLTVASFDNSVRLEKYSSGYKIYPLREGAAYLRAYYNGIVSDVEVIVYDNFFTTNYKSFFSAYDRSLLESNDQMNALCYTCMEFFDIIYAYCADVKNITDPINIKWKMLTMLGESYGFQRMTFPNGRDSKEHIGEYMYRELLSNLVDLLEIRGTKLSYDLLFNALGYDISLKEFWYDEIGNLIGIDPYNNDTEYSVISVDGLEINTDDEINALLTIDPRSQISSASAYNRCNKSHYIKASYKQKNGLPVDSQQTKILNQYFEFLRPTHIAYLLATNQFSIKNYENDVFKDDVLKFDFSDNDGLQVVGYKSLGANPTIKSVGTQYFNEQSVFELSDAQSRYEAIQSARPISDRTRDAEVTPRHRYESLYYYKGDVYQQSDPILLDNMDDALFVAGGNTGDSDYNGEKIHKVWSYETGGFAAEHYKQFSSDSISVNKPIEIIEKWQEVFKYNSASIVADQEYANRDPQPPIDATQMIVGRKYQIAKTPTKIDFTKYAKEYITGKKDDIFTCTAIPVITGDTVYALDYRNNRLLDTSNDLYTYGRPNGLKYDVGTFLKDGQFDASNVTLIVQAMKALLTAGNQPSVIKSSCITTFGITQQKADNIYKMMEEK